MAHTSCFLLMIIFLSACSGNSSDYEAPGIITSSSRPLGETSTDQRQILFGDLHVHTSYSMDAFEKSLSFMGGEGAQPPADACDFARYCSQLDFWSINDHGEYLSPDRWQHTKDIIRQCNAVSADENNPDTVAFLVGVVESHAGVEKVLRVNFRYCQCSAIFSLSYHKRDTLSLSKSTGSISTLNSGMAT